MKVPKPLASQTVAVLGGTGPQGRGLARRFAAAGLTVVIGSRNTEWATVMARELASATGGEITGANNFGAARASDIVVVAVPWAGHCGLLTDLAEVLVGKIVVDCVNPLGFDKQGAYAVRVDEGSAAQQGCGAAARRPDPRCRAAFGVVRRAGLTRPVGPLLTHHYSRSS